MKKVMLFILLSQCLICFLGCNGIKNPPDIEDYINNYNCLVSENSFVTYDQAEVIREQLFEESKRFIAEVKFTGQDNYANYERISTLTYNYYDNIGWELDDVSFDSFQMKCFKGRTIQELESDIQNNFPDYIEGCTKMTVCKVGDVSTDNVQKIIVSCLRKDGKVIGTYDNAELLFTYKNGVWNFTDANLGNATNYYLDLVGTKWHREKSANGQRKGEIIEIVSVSPDSKTIVFKYGDVSCTANFLGEYNDFEGSHVKYIPDENIYLGEAGSYYGNCKAYMEEIKFATFAGAGNDCIIIEALVEGWNGYDKTTTYFYDIIRN